MLKRFAVSALAATLSFAPLVASAQTFASTPSGIHFLQPIPAMACGDPFGFCTQANQYISAYNSYVGNINSINNLGWTYARYPQTVNTGFSTNMQQVANVLQQSQGLNYTVGNVERQVSLQWPTYTPGTPLTTLNGTLETNTATAIVAELKGAGLLDQSNTDASMSAAIRDIRNAGAQAKNQTQELQVITQLLTLIWEEQVKEQRLLGLRMSEEAQHDLSDVASKRQQRLYDESLVTRLQTAADGTPPILSPAQINTIFGAHQ